MKCFYLKDYRNNEIFDVYAESLEQAIIKAALYLGIEPKYIIERF